MKGLFFCLFSLRNGGTTALVCGSRLETGRAGCHVAGARWYVGCRGKVRRFGEGRRGGGIEEGRESEEVWGREEEKGWKSEDVWGRRRIRRGKRREEKEKEGICEVRGRGMREEKGRRERRRKEEGRIRRGRGRGGKEKEGK